MYQPNMYAQQNGAPNWDRPPQTDARNAQMPYNPPPVHQQNQHVQHNQRAQRDQPRVGDYPDNRNEPYNSASAGAMRPRNDTRYDSAHDRTDVRSQYPDANRVNRPNPVEAPPHAVPQSHPGLPSSGTGTVDIGKLTNLISAFQQKQQQNQPRPGERGDSRNEGPHAVQQGLQNAGSNVNYARMYEGMRPRGGHAQGNGEANRQGYGYYGGGM